LRRAVYSQFRTLPFPFGKTAKLEVALICSEEPRSLPELIALVSLEPLVMAEHEVTTLVALEPQVMAAPELTALAMFLPNHVVFNKNH
jgi:hypothetical protein